MESVDFAVSKYLGKYLAQLPNSLKRKLLPRQFGQTHHVHTAYKKLDKHWTPNPVHCFSHCILLFSLEDLIYQKKTIQNAF